MFAKRTLLESFDMDKGEGQLNSDARDKMVIRINEVFEHYGACAPQMCACFDWCSVSIP